MDIVHWIKLLEKKTYSQKALIEHLDKHG